MDAFITYEGLPVNSGGSHSLGKKQVDEIYADTLTFLKAFTNKERPIRTELTFYSSQNGSYKTLPNLWQLIKGFGVPSYDSWTLGKARQHFFTWKLSLSHRDKAFQFLDKFSNLPQNEYGPLVLSFMWHFQFVNPKTKKILDGQEKIPVIDFRQHNSQIYLRLGQKSTISVWFALPFTDLNDTSREYISSMIRVLPFKPSDKHWRIWRQSKNQKWNPQFIDISPS